MGVDSMNSGKRHFPNCAPNWYEHLQNCKSCGVPGLQGSESVKVDKGRKSGKPATLS